MVLAVVAVVILIASVAVAVVMMLTDDGQESEGRTPSDEELIIETVTGYVAGLNQADADVARPFTCDDAAYAFVDTGLTWHIEGEPRIEGGVARVGIEADDDEPITTDVVLNRDEDGWCVNLAEMN